MTTAVSAAPPLVPNCGPLVWVGDGDGLAVGDEVGDDVGVGVGEGDVVGLTLADGLGVGLQVADGEAFVLFRVLPPLLPFGDLPCGWPGGVSLLPCPFLAGCPEVPPWATEPGRLLLPAGAKTVWNRPSAKTPATTMTTAPATARVGRSHAMVGPSHRRRPVSPALPRWAQS